MQQTGQAYPIAPVNYHSPPPPSVWQTYRQVFAQNQEREGPLHSAVTGVRHNLESAFVGALLGLIQGKLGTLDIAGKYPADGIAALVLYILSVKEAGKPDGFASDLRTLSQSCTSVAFFRKTAEWASEKPEDKKPASAVPQYKDSILEAGRQAGL